MHTVRVKQAKSLWQQTVGLIGAEKPYPLLLRTRFGIHTFGVGFPLDIIILDQRYRVMRLQKNLLPNQFFFWPPRWSIVLELPKNTIDQKQITLGDRLSLVIS